MPKRSLTDLVLDTIDTISARKNRPNLVRIFRHLNRLYDISLPTCESLLQSLLKEGKVVRVTYKGNISYRNALKWKKYSYYMKKNMGSELPGSLLTNAISELVVQEPDYLSMGVPCEILEEHLLSMHDDNINKEAIQKLLQRELKLESLLQLDNGNYFLGPKPVVNTFFHNSVPDVKLDSVKKVKPVKLKFSEPCEKIINLCDSNSFYRADEENAQEEGRQLKLSDSLGKGMKCDMISLEKTSMLNSIPKESSSSSASGNCTSSSDSSQPSPVKNETNGSSVNSLNGIIEKLACHKLTEETRANEADEKDSASPNEAGLESQVEKVSVHVVKSDAKAENDVEIENEPPNQETNVSITDVNKIIGVESKDLSNVDGSEIVSVVNKPSSKVTASSKSPSPRKSKQSDEDEEEDKVIKAVTPILERGRRKKKTKYDASEYYFPSLKRKTRDSSDSDRKEEKRKKKKKKKESMTSSNISGVFAKRVIFPGNSSMCCECRCYVSKVKLDPMIYCTTCSNQGHQSCAYKTMTDKNWYCVDCRQDVDTCKICKKMPLEKDRGLLYGCSCCGSSYHKACHNPTIKLPFSKTWHCFSCPPSPTDQKRDKSDSGEKGECSEAEEGRERKKACDSVENKSYLSEINFFKEEPPDPTNWTTKDVYNYFRKYFDEDVAKIILEQGIDGYSLKLLDRAYILKLDFKLGICLKILLHIRRLQLHSNNLVEIWSD